MGSMHRLSKLSRGLVFAGSVVVIGSLVFVLSRHPSHERAWEVGQERLPRAYVEGDRLTIDHFRDFVWRLEAGQETADDHYVTRTFDLAALQGVDVFISHFSDFEGLAHIFLSFTFATGDPLVISVETRREVGETYSPFLGMLRQYELIYIAGSERDLVGLRTSLRGERVYRYPTVASPEVARSLLLALVADIQAIERKPAFYHTVLANCTNLVTRRVEDISPVAFPFTWKTLLPGYFDTVLVGLGLIPGATSKTWDKERYRLDPVRADTAPADFSTMLHLQYKD